MGTKAAVVSSLREDLIAEARYLHRSIFSMPLPEEIACRYADAHPLVFDNMREKAESPLLRKIIAAGLDAEAVEFALRVRNKQNLLRQKYQILCYLLELEPQYYSVFHLENSAASAAFFTLSAHALRSAYKFVKGLFLVARFRLAG